MSTRVIHVDIHGQRYAIRTELDAQYIAELAAFVDDKMRLAARDLASSDPVRLAVVTALNIADELWRARADATGTQRRLLSRAADIERIVDGVLREAQLKIAL